MSIISRGHSESANLTHQRYLNALAQGELLKGLAAWHTPNVSLIAQQQ